MEIKFLSLIILSLWLCLATGDECNVIPQEDNIDWSRVEGTTWYQVLNAGDAEDKAASCHVVKVLKRFKDTIDMDFIILDDTNPEKINRTRQQFVKNGQLYDMNRIYEGKWMDISVEREKKKNPKLLKDDVQEMEERYSYPIALYTDYETYFMGVRCTQDNQYVFIYSRMPRLTTTAALKIFNALKKYNSPVVLDLAGCKDIENIDNYIN